MIDPSPFHGTRIPGARDPVARRVARVERGPVALLVLLLVVAVLGSGCRIPGDALSDAAAGFDALVDELGACGSDGPCPHFAYVTSPSMPLSEEGIPEISRTAAALGVPLTVVQAEDVQSALASEGDETRGRKAGRAETRGWKAKRAETRRKLASSIVASGAALHYPSVVLFDGPVVRGPAVLGHKRADGYRRLLEPRVDALRAGEAAKPAAGAEDLAAASVDPLDRGASANEGVSAETPSPVPPIEIVWRHPVSPTPGAFFRRVPGTRYIAYDQDRDVWLHHLESGERFRGPGWIDFVPTPEGALFVTPADGSGGLEFYDAREVLREGRAGRGEDVRPVYVDPAMSDQYPSVGILEGEAGERVRYRILISWFEGLAIREYDVRWAGNGGVRVEPVTEKIDACPGMGLSTPILSKDGHEIAARDESTGTTRLFRVEADGSCEPVLDFGRGTSKVGFSDDGRLIAFGSTEGVTGDRATGRSRTFVFDRESGETVQVPESGSRSLVIPEFVGPDSLLFLASPDSRRRTVEFRMACCVR